MTTLLYIFGIITASYSLHKFCSYNKLDFDVNKKLKKNVPPLFSFLIFLSFIFYVLVYFYCIPHNSVILGIVYFYCFVFLIMDTARIIYYCLKDDKKD